MKDLTEQDREQASHIRDCHTCVPSLSSFVSQCPHISKIEVDWSIQASHHSISHKVFCIPRRNLSLTRLLVNLMREYDLVGNTSPGGGLPRSLSHSAIKPAFTTLTSASSLQTESVELNIPFQPMHFCDPIIVEIFKMNWMLQQLPSWV